MDLWNNLGFNLCAAPSVCPIVTTSDNRKKSEMRVSANWCVAIEHQRSSSIRVIFVDYQTSELQCNYQSYIQMNSIGDAQGFSGKTPISLSRGFSVKTLTEVTLSWKTKLNRSISTIEDRIPGWLQHCHKTYCKKGGCYELRSLGLDNRTTLVLSNTRELNKDPFTNQSTLYTTTDSPCLLLCTLP